MENKNDISVKKITVDTVESDNGIRRTTNTATNTANNREDVALDQNLKVRKVVYFILGVFEVLFAFRLVFKLLGANPDSGFASIIYTVSGVFLAPFNAIFGTVKSQTSVLEYSTIVGMFVYALVAYGIVKVFEIYNTPRAKGIQ